MKNLKDLKFDLLPEQQLYRKYLDEYDKDRDKDKAEKIKDALFKSVKVFKDKESGREYVIKKTTQDGYAEKDGQIVVNRDAFDQGTAGPDGKSVDNKSIDPNQSSKGQKSPQLTEVLTLQQRQKRKMAFRRSRMKRKIGAEKSRKRLAGKEKLEKRSQKQARTTIIGRLFPALKDKPRSDWSLSDKKRAEKIVKDKKPIIKRFAKKMFKDVRKKEVERLAKYRSSKKEEVDPRNEYIEEQTRKEIQSRLISAGKSQGLEKHSNVARIYNPKDISNNDFVSLIKKEFEVEDVIVIAPKEAGNPSSSFYIFKWDAHEITLAGKVKGRGSRQTEEQEISWLLVLSAYYNGGGDLEKDELLDFMVDKSEVYSKITNSKGKFLNESDAQGLVYWLSQDSQKGWFDSHRAQAKKFIEKVSSTPQRFVKDYSTLDIVQQAKKLFPVAVPGQTFDKDKWNPADVWLYYEDLKEHETLADLNNYLLSSAEGGKGIIGISLKLGKGGITTINARKRPVYVVDGFTMKYGDLFAQNVSGVYSGEGLEGYSVTYRLFTPKIGELIRGEAQRKKALAAQGKVYLKYIDHLTGGKQATNAVSSVAKKIVERDRNTGVFTFTKDGDRTYRRVKNAWPVLRDSNLVEWGRNAVQSDYNKLLDPKEFLEYVNEYAVKNKVKESEMQVRIMARFETIMLGTVFASIKRKNIDKLYEVVLGMLLYGKSESDWSAPHMKAQ